MELLNATESDELALPNHLDTSIIERGSHISNKLLEVRHEYLDLSRVCEGKEKDVRTLPTLNSARAVVNSLHEKAAQLETDIDEFRLAGENLPRLSDSKLVIERADVFSEQHQALSAMLRRSHRLLHALEQKLSLKESRELFALSSGTFARDERRLLKERATKLGGEAMRQVTADASKDLTSALLAAEEMLQTEIEKSREISVAIEASTSLMKTVGGEYRGLSSVMKQSRRLVTRLAKRNWTDRFLIFFGFGLFLMATLYVFRRRFYVPGGWLLYDFVIFVVSIAYRILNSIKQVIFSAFRSVTLRFDSSLDILVNSSIIETSKTPAAIVETSLMTIPEQASATILETASAAILETSLATILATASATVLETASPTILETTLATVLETEATDEPNTKSSTLSNTFSQEANLSSFNDFLTSSISNTLSDISTSTEKQSATVTSSLTSNPKLKTKSFAITSKPVASNTIAKNDEL